MPDTRLSARRKPSLGKCLWLGYAVVLGVILVNAAILRFRVPQTPLFDGDSWGYLYPAFSKLNGGGFEHIFGRNFVYPAFVFIVLCLFGSYEPLSVCQHLVGLLTGVVMALAWVVLCEFLRVSPRVRWVARFLGLVAVADYLFSRFPFLFEHTLRPEAVFPLFLLLTVLLNLCALHARHVVRRPAAERWLLALNFVIVMLAQSLKPSTGLGVMAANLPMAFWLLRRDEPWLTKAKFTGAALALVVAGLWLPEQILKRDDPTSKTFLPTMLFTVHAKIIHEQILDDLRTGATAPYSAAWLAEFNRGLEHSFIGAELPENGVWHTIGFNADYLIYRESIFDPFFPRGQEAPLAAFCRHYYWRVWLHRPGEMIRKIMTELRVVYRMPRARRLRWFLNVEDTYTGKSQRPLSYDYRASWNCVTHEGVASRMTSPYPQDYLQRTQRLRDTHAVVRQYPWVGYFNNLLRWSFLPMLGVALLAGAALLFQPATRSLALAVMLILCINFALFLTIAVAHSLGFDRYVENQRACTLFGEFAALLLPGQWLLRKPAAGRETPPVTIEPL